MASNESFADPVVVPGPNIRSLFVDTEVVEAVDTVQVDLDVASCPVCERELPASVLICPDDGTLLLRR